jgi:undecaprenyl-diphosphatase
MSVQVNSFDRVILEFLSRPAFHSPALDEFAVRLSNDLLLKGGVLMAAMWWVWFSRSAGSSSTGVTEGEVLSAPDERARADRRTILLGYCGTVLALVIARTLEVLGQFRWRPLNYPELFHVPFGVDISTSAYFRNDNCFPSDHAALFFGLATILFLVRRRLGIIAYLYVALVISLPRLYLMLHYPTDIIVGGLLGALCVMAICSLGEHVKTLRWFGDKLIDWSIHRPASFYACLFVWCFSVAEMFEGVRMVLYVRTVVKTLLAHH